MQENSSLLFSLAFDLIRSFCLTDRTINSAVMKFGHRNHHEAGNPLGL